MTTVWAHRGASATERENTVAAFARAVALGADGIELDVRRSADGHPVIHHDPLPAGPVPSHVPGFAEALDACGDLVVNIEIKEPPDLAEVVVAEVRRRGTADRVVVSCFDLATVDRVRALDAGMPTAFLSMLASRPDLVTCVGHGHGAYHPHHAGVDAALVDEAHRLGLAVNVWTVDDPARIVELAAMGVDALVSNVPDVALRALGR
jgi:glycerophosphoryl diester phosphodiesterase